MSEDKEERVCPLLFIVIVLMLLHPRSLRTPAASSSSRTPATRAAAPPPVRSFCRSRRTRSGISPRMAAAQSPEYRLSLAVATFSRVPPVFPYALLPCAHRACRGLMRGSFQTARSPFPYFCARLSIVTTSCRVMRPCGAVPSVMPFAFAAFQSLAAQLATVLVRCCAR